MNPRGRVAFAGLRHCEGVLPERTHYGGGVRDMGSLRLGATADSLGKLPVHAHIEVAALRVGLSVDLPPDPGQLAALRRTPRADRIVRRADLCGCPCVDCRRRISCGHLRW